MKKFENHPVDFDPRWSVVFKTWEPKIKEALGENLLLLHHIGSTAIAGLTSNPESREKYQAGKNELIQEIMAAANDWKKLLKTLDLLFGIFQQSPRNFHKSSSPP